MLYDSPHVRLDREGQVARLWLRLSADYPGLLTAAALAELDEALAVVERSPGLGCLIVRNARPGQWIAGLAAAELTDSVHRLLLAQRGQRVCRRLSELAATIPTLAVIEGPCLDVGLEIALACSLRLVVVGPRVRLGMPGTRLGITPFCGGTARLVARVGLRRAWSMLVEGQTLTPVQAQRVGLVDRLAVPLRLEIDLWQMSERMLAQGPGGRRRRFWGWFDGLTLTATPLAQHPSPRLARLGRIVRALARDGVAAAEAAERHAFTEFASYDPCATRLDSTATAGLSAATAATARLSAVGQLATPPVGRPAGVGEARVSAPSGCYPGLALPRRVVVVGGGERGLALTRLVASQGYSVALVEACPSALAAARTRLDTQLAQAVRDGELHPTQAQSIRAHIDWTSGWGCLGEAQLVCEAVTPELSLRRQVFARLAERCLPTTICLTTAIVPEVDRLGLPPERLGWTAGLLLSPADGQPLELNQFATTYASTVETVARWLAQMGQRVQRIQYSASGVWPPVVLAYLNEAVRLVAEGVGIDELDETMQQLGVEVGPLAWLDALSLRRVAEWAEQWRAHRGAGAAVGVELEECFAAWPTLRFYESVGSRRRSCESARQLVWHLCGRSVCGQYASVAEVAERLTLLVVNAASAQLGHGEATDPASIDAILMRLPVWPSARMGPLRWAERIGLAEIVARLQRLAQRCGARYTPSLELVRRADAAEPFFDTPQSPAADPVNHRLVQPVPPVKFCAQLFALPVGQP